MEEKSVDIFCDGGSRGNPGPAAGAFLALVDGKIIYQTYKFLGKQTNNFAEYSAVIMAVEWLQKNNFPTINFNLDSQLVVRQLTGLYKVKSDNIRDLFLTIKKLEVSLPAKLTFKYIPRLKNVLADTLVNKALDEN